jgi:hypothetical protein
MILKNKNFKKNNQKKGVALLFSILLSSVLFTVATGIIKIALEEVKFNAPLRDAGEAFFAADIGVECAMYNDTVNAFKADGTAPGSINCVFQQSISITGNNPWTFAIGGLGNSGNACAQVTIEKTFDGNDPPNLLNTKIISRGHTNGDLNCNPSSFNRAERVIEVNY